MIVRHGEIYCAQGDREQLKGMPRYVLKRYEAISRTLAREPFHITRRRAACIARVSLRHFYRILKRFLKEGIPGLVHKDRNPKTRPNETPLDIQEKVLAVRWNTGFGPRNIADLVNESLRREEREKQLHPSVVYNILRRHGEVKEERRFQRKWKFFEWGHPDRLLQVDLTKLNGVPILTILDDHTRKGWSLALPNMKDKTVVRGMKKLIRHKFDNLLTDNGSQFSRKNSEIRKYCEEFVREKHIWTSVHHPQTMGKLSAYQKGLKRFLRHRMGRSRRLRDLNHWIQVYENWYNNGKYHSSIGTVPEKKYSGQVDSRWYEKLVKELKLGEVLTV